MKARRSYWQEGIQESEEIAGFGGATVVRDLQGKLQIQGGNESERKQAHDWMLRFMWPTDQVRPSSWPGILL